MRPPPPLSRRPLLSGPGSRSPPCSDETRLRSPIMKSSLRLPCRAAIAVVALAWLSTACQHIKRQVTPVAVIPPNFASMPEASAAAVDASLLQRPSFEYRLGPGDVLEIEVLG